MFFLPVELDLVGSLDFLLFLPGLLEESMIQTLINGDPEVRVEDQDLVKKVNGFFSRPWVNSGQVLTFSLGESTQVLWGLLVRHEALVIFIGRPNHLEDHIQLIVLAEREPRFVFLGMLVWREREATLPWEERLPIQVSGSTLLHHSQHFRKDTAHWPDIYGRPIFFLQEDQLWSPVPSSHHMPSELSLDVLSLVLGFDKAWCHLLTLLLLSLWSLRFLVIV